MFCYGMAHLLQKGESAVLQLDLSDLHSMTSKASEAAAIFGHIDSLVNNAGISYRGCIEQTTLDVDQSLMTVNYLGQVALTKGKVFKPGHEKTCLCHNTQQRRMHSLISVSIFIVHCLECNTSSFYIRNFKPPAGLCR